MADRQLRDLERKFRETGSLDDEAAWLLNRVRVGNLQQERLDLAAYCGHQGARRALGDTGPLLIDHLAASAPFDPSKPSLTPTRLDQFSSEAVAAIAVNCSKETIDDLSAGEQWERVHRQSLEAAWDWAVCPCNRHAAECGRRSKVMLGELGRLGMTLSPKAKLGAVALMQTMQSLSHERGQASAVSALLLLREAVGLDRLRSVLETTARRTLD